MDKKKVIKTVLFVLAVPTIAVVGYYGIKYAKKKYDERKLKKDIAAEFDEINDKITGE